MSERTAFFDVDGTLVASNIVRYGIEIRTQRMSPVLRRAWTAAYLPRVPWLLALDAVSRESFQRSFYRIYRGLDADEIDRGRSGCSKCSCARASDRRAPRASPFIARAATMSF
jgi:hypothetical protein